MVAIDDSEYISLLKIKYEKDLDGEREFARKLSKENAEQEKGHKYFVDTLFTCTCTVNRNVYINGGDGKTWAECSQCHKKFIVVEKPKGAK